MAILPISFGVMVGLAIGITVAGAGLALTDTTLPGERPDSDLIWPGETPPPDCDVYVRPGLRVCSKTE